MKEQPENQEEKQEPPLPLPRHIVRIVEELRNKESGYKAWLEAQTKTPSKYSR